MAEQLPFDEAVVRFKDNEERFDLFINDAVGYLTREGVSVESIRAFLDRLETEITGYANLAPRVTTLESEMDAVEGRLDIVEPKVTTLEGEMDTAQTDITALQGVVESPSEWISYLPIGSDYTTPSLTAATLTKVLLDTTVKFSNDFALVDIGGGDFRVQYQGSVAKDFNIRMTTSMQTGTSNTIVKLRMYKGTTASPDVIEPGVGIVRKVGTGTDTGALGIEGAFTLNPLDVVAVAVESSLGGTVTFIESSIVIQEKRG